MIIRVLLLLLVASPLFAQAPDFATEIFPILKSSCLRCHKAPRKDRRGKLRQPKAGLRLDGKGWILRGGDSGPVLEKGKPEASPLWLRVTLPEDDPDVMPQGGDLLEKAQQDLLKRWIASGASFGAWSGAEGPKSPGSSQERDTTLQDLAQGLDRLSQAKKRQLAPLPFVIEASLRGSPLLRAESFSHESEIDAAAVEKLCRVAGQHLSHLNLGRTAISNAALTPIARLPRLVHLDLHGTQVDSAGIRPLTKAPKLQVLNLSGTQVGDSAARDLARCTHLRRLYLWNSKISEAALAQLRKKLPSTSITYHFAAPSGEGRPQRDATKGRGAKRRRKKK